MEIISLPVDKNLASVLNKITLFNADGSPLFRQKLTPTPYSCLSYNLYNDSEFVAGDQSIKPESPLQVTGPKTRDDIYAIHGQRLKLILFEFSACGFYQVIGKSPALYVNRTVLLADVIGHPKTANLSQELAGQHDLRIGAEIIQRFIQQTVNPKPLKCSYLYSALDQIEQSHGHITVGEICSKIHLSERQLNRKFTEIIGLRPMEFIKLKQLHHIIKLLDSPKFSTLKELAYETGFYDPSHFNNQFRKLTGMSPGAFLESNDHVAFKYYNDPIAD